MTIAFVPRGRLHVARKYEESNIPSWYTTTPHQPFIHERILESSAPLIDFSFLSQDFSADRSLP